MFQNLLMMSTFMYLKLKIRLKRMRTIQQRERWCLAERDRPSLFAQALIRGALEAASSIYQFVSFLHSSSPLPGFPLSGRSLAGNKQRRSGTPDPWLPGNHTLTWWSGSNFRGLCEHSIKVAIKLKSQPFTHTHANKTNKSEGVC